MTALNEIVRPAVLALGFELLGCEYLSQGRYSRLRIYVDSDRGVSVDDCARVSEQVSAILDVEDPMAGEYTLEVSSPGLDRPLFILEHYKRFVGQQIKLRLRFPLDNRSNFTGLLKTVDEEKESIEMVVDGKAYILYFSNIEKANLISEA